MSKTGRPNYRRAGRERHVSVRAVRRESPDLRKLSHALLALAIDRAQTSTDADSRSACRTETAADTAEQIGSEHRGDDV